MLKVRPNSNLKEQLRFRGDIADPKIIELMEKCTNQFLK